MITSVKILRKSAGKNNTDSERLMSRRLHQADVLLIKVSKEFDRFFQSSCEKAVHIGLTATADIDEMIVMLMSMSQHVTLLWIAMCR